MAVAGGSLTWGQATATVAVGETVTVPVVSDVAPNNNLSFSPVAEIVSSTTRQIVFRGLSVGTKTIPTNTSWSQTDGTVTSDTNTTNAFTLTVTAAVEDESYLNKRGLTHFWENIDSLKQDTLTAGTNISINNGTISSSQPAATTSSLGVVQVGSGLAISSGGVLSATGGGTADSVAWGHITGTLADQSDLNTALGGKANTADLATVATSGSYNDLTNKPTIPTVNNATLTIQKNSTTIDTFTANASQNKTINITVPVTASDVSALPASTKYAASLTASINTTTYVMTLTLKDQDGNTLGTAQTIDLPLESVVVNGTYDSTNKKIVLTLQGGGTIDIPVGDLVAGLQSEITSTNKLDSDLVDDTNQTHKFMTSAEKTKLSGIAAGAEVNVQSDWNQTTTTADDYIKNKPQLATVATSGAYSDLSGTPSLATVATSGSYNDLSNKPTIPAAQVNSDWNSTSGVSEILNKPTLSTVATTGAYGDLTGTPNLATVATSGSYNDLSNKPTIPTVNNATLTIQKNGTNVQTFTANQSTNATANITVPTKTSDLTNDSNFVESGDLATVATSGSYNDLSNKPTIPAAQVNSDWNASSGVAQILNKPTLATVATSGSYNDLSNKPTIPTVNNATLTIQKNGANVQTFTANQSTNATANITVPTKTSDLTNDSGFAADSDVVHKAGTETITGEKTFSNTKLKVMGSGSAEYRFNFYAEKRFDALSVGPSYVNWDEEKKDGTWHRIWRLSFPTDCNFWGRLTIGITGSWSSYNASGYMEKQINVAFNGATLYNNVGRYSALGLNIEKDFRISECIWNSDTSQWEIIIYSQQPQGNNNPRSVVLKFETYQEALITAFEGITIASTPEISQISSYVNPKATVDGSSKTFYFADMPVYQDPYGYEIINSNNISSFASFEYRKTSDNLSPDADTPAGWKTALESTNGVYRTWYNTSSKFTNQPGTFGFLETFLVGSDIYQRWHTQSSGPILYRSGNSSGWSSPSSGAWNTVATTSDIKTYTAGTGINIDANNVISATAVANTFASYSNGTLYITNNATNADTENF